MPQFQFPLIVFNQLKYFLEQNKLMEESGGEKNNLLNFQQPLVFSLRNT